MGSSDGGCEQPRMQTKTFLRESVSRFLLALFIYISETGEKYADSDWSVLISGDCVAKFWRCWVQLKLLIRHLLLGFEPRFRQSFTLCEKCHVWDLVWRIRKRLIFAFGGEHCLALALPQ